MGLVEEGQAKFSSRGSSFRDTMSSKYSQLPSNINEVRVVRITRGVEVDISLARVGSQCGYHGVW